MLTLVATDTEVRLLEATRLVGLHARVWGYGPSVLAAAVSELLDKDSHDYGALAILCEQRRTRPRRLLPLELASHVVDRDVIPHDLGGYDDDSQ